jgi:hypothetical protein
MANAKMADVVFTSEGNRLTIGPDCRPGSANAATYLVCRLLTDAIFSNDIRAIQLVISRVDGGLPKDTEVDLYQTQFSDCLEQVMNMTTKAQLSVRPDDTVMMGICKSLYALAVQDIYWDARRQVLRKRPPTDLKNERDAALRIILERLGGRKTLMENRQMREAMEDADWIAELPSGTM